MGLALSACAPEPATGGAGAGTGDNPGSFTTVATQTAADGPEPELLTLPTAYTRLDTDQFRVAGNGGSYAFTSADGELECMFAAVDRPDTALNGFTGSCGHSEPHLAESTTVVMVTGPGRPHSFAHLEGAYPGTWLSGERVLEPGGYLDIGGQVACFSASADSIGCLEYDTGEGYQLVGAEFRPFDPEHAEELFGTDAAMVQLLSRRAVFTLDTGERLLCRVAEETLGCHGGNWSLGDGSGMVDVLRFDLGGARPTLAGDRSGRVGRLPHIGAQRVGPGSYLMAGLSVENSDGRLVFAREDGASLWISPEEHGVM
ncbi:hypothetical protein A605_07020 [Corynebacterium halotolerans YIM 70093 = DSM 44683]|uniref:Uncharacterized protein n=1 Tax=Corynebacterium halotolerans YIM 70093 = DSM 44683 TaxID=1121362 RepID=M1P6Y4_9CORY|nr:hypothetical protein A605_07020 [Corynebacterium halotolerans YIM 70093 = DSM 44683]